jgi:hypothetical protein
MRTEPNAPLHPPISSFLSTTQILLAHRFA